ncbi:MAG: acetate--CoA ligase family protein, partial [Candidatus Methanoperedens sp.]|nr:acetate--CoA ligase family protein [Candidatus Methanoperedens sp.]
MKILTEHEAKNLLSKYDIPVTEESVATGADEAVEIAMRIGTPVAMKISSLDISHKSDVGGVVLNVGLDELRTTYDEIISRVKKAVPDANIAG